MRIRCFLQREIHACTFIFIFISINFVVNFTLSNWLNSRRQQQKKTNADKNDEKATRTSTTTTTAKQREQTCLPINDVVLFHFFSSFFFLSLSLFAAALDVAQQIMYSLCGTCFYLAMSCALIENCTQDKAQIKSNTFAFVCSCCCCCVASLCQC